MPAARTDGPLYRFGRYLSVLGHPFIVLPASIGAVSVLRGGQPRDALLVACVFMAASAAVLVGIRTGCFNDFDVSERERRPGFYLMVIGAAVGLGLWLRDKPEALGACVIAAAVLVICGLINRWTKASLHTAFSLYAAGFWATWSLSAGLIALPFAAGVAWSRIYLGRHTDREVLVGAAVGLVAAACFMLVPGNGSLVSRSASLLERAAMKAEPFAAPSPVEKVQHARDVAGRT